MGSGRRMCWIQLLLVNLASFSSLICLAGGSPMEVMSAPNVLRIGTTENIFVEIQDCTSQDDINVQISVRSFPTKLKVLASTSVTLTKTKHYQDFGSIKIPTEDFNEDPDMRQFVYLRAEFPGRVLESVVLVSFQSGYIFIQTDKPIYTQGSTVRYRVFGLTTDMKLMENEGRMEDEVTIEIVTSEGITIDSTVMTLRSGITEGVFYLRSIISYGLWKVVAKFNSNPQQIYAAEFEVKEYVLLSFEVELTPSTPFFYVDSESLTVNIKAMYTFGEEVDGAAYVVFGIINNGNKSSFPSSPQRVPIQRGAGVVKLMRHHITQTFPNINEIMGSSIYVAVSVLAESGGEMVEAEMTTIKIVTSPYTIHFKRTRKYFQPGMPYDLMIEVVNPDGSPAPSVAVVVNPGNVQGRTSGNGIAKVIINTALWTETMSITARTNDLTLASQRQASASMTARSYKAKSNNYLLIHVDETEVEVGNFMKFSLFLNRPESQEKDITYLILSKGQLVKHNRYKSQGQLLVSLMLQITKDMLPSFRIVAYYHTNSHEVVSDSVWVDVKDSCMGSFKLESVRPLSFYEPRKAFKLKIVGDPEAKVGLVVADKNAYVLSNKLHLTQKKIWDMVEKFDTGCTPGGGKDSMSVFYDAGLLFETKDYGTPDRTDVMCPDSSRRKRSINVMNFRTRLVNQYEGRGQRECCLDGMRDIPVAYTCERRSKYIVDGPACIEAFMHCCKEMERQRFQKKQGNHSLARSKRAEGDDDVYIENDEIISRTNFPESWHWMVSVLDACPQRDYNCKSTTLVKHLPLPDSVTTWQVTGISLSRSHGICVSDPLEVRIYKILFIELRLPYSAVRGEQLEIKAILHNYYPEPVTVRVELKKENNLCSTAYKQGWYRQIVQVGAQTSRSVPFIIVPMKDGEIPIEVKAAIKDSYFSDGIKKVLHVVPAGKLMKSVKTVTLNPAQGVDGKQVTTINSKIPLRHVAPNTPSTTLISLTGEMSPLVMSGDSMGELIIEPLGSGEENMIGVTLPVIATIFLDQTNQWKFLALKKRNDALQHIRKGYQNELAYRKTDGSFSGVTTEPASTWLTAYVAKVFSMASNLVTVERSVICDAIRFLILSAQQLDGMFIEKGRVINSKMTGDVTGTDWDASLTAFCLIALQESHRICSESVNMMPVSINRSTDYLEQRLPGLISPYAVAMTSYALATENKLNKEILYKFAAPDRSHWPVEKGNVYTLEATAYALLALVKAKAFEEAEHVVKWLLQQERLNGGYGSTQATVTVYQAVAEYWTRAKDLRYNMEVEMSVPGVASSHIYTFNKENQHVTRVSKLNSINKDVKVAVTGTGKATLKMESLYYMPPTEKTDCDKFNLTVQVLPERISDNEKIYKLKIEVLYKEKPRDTAVSILEVGLPTGFTPNKHDLELLSNGRDQTKISKYDIPQSERGSLIIYLNEISHTRPQEISFRIHQEMKVGILQPAAVSVYDFFDKEKPCVQFYHPERSGALIQLCSNNQCVCAEENCSKLKKNVKNEDRVTKICEVTHTFRVTFAYKVRVEEFRDELSADIYSMRIIDIIKPGGIDANPKGQLRPFLSTKICRDALDLRENKTYLIMGSSKHIFKDEERYQYLLSERTWIEYWPTDAECHTEQFRGTCKSIEEIVLEYETWGCKM